MKKSNMTKQATEIVNKVVTKLEADFSVAPSFNTAAELAKETGLVKVEKGRYGGTYATVAGMSFASLTDAIELPTSRVEAEAARTAKRREAALKALAEAQAVLAELGPQELTRQNAA